MKLKTAIIPVMSENRKIDLYKIFFVQKKNVLYLSQIIANNYIVLNEMFIIIMLFTHYMNHVRLR